MPREGQDPAYPHLSLAWANVGILSETECLLEDLMLSAGMDSSSHTECHCNLKSQDVLVLAIRHRAKGCIWRGRAEETCLFWGVCGESGSTTYELCHLGIRSSSGKWVVIRESSQESVIHAASPLHGRFPNLSAPHTAASSFLPPICLITF